MTQIQPNKQQNGFRIFSIIWFGQLVSICLTMMTVTQPYVLD